MKLPATNCQPPTKKGSALLIVLGMFAFMLVSAVAFSVYMRASRAPSSYVRRNASTRQVLKAAVARAIDEVDTAIGNDPFPDVGFNHDYGNTGTVSGDKYKNDNWHGRVFTPSNELALAETVSTLTLEGLGYLPPCLVNEVRYWSRHTRTAKWHSFNYGLGRYAFTAVNVSDFFDLNMFSPDSAGNRRPYLNRSSAPHGRISPTYLFRSGQNGDMDTGGSAASAFLNVLAGGSGVGGGSYPSLSDVPFISMMDFNLAVGSLGSLGGLASPYMHLIKDNNTATFLSGDMEEAARRAMFIAGGWNGDSNLTYQAYSAAYGGTRINLRYPEYQPFASYSWFPEATTLAHCYDDVSENHPFWKPYNNNFPIIATAMLCDYLDFDNVPLSLCIPCTEAVPMLCGVELNDDCVKYSVNMVEQTLQDANAEQGTKKKIKRTYSLHVEIDGLETTLTAVYPFLNGKQGHANSYTAETFARVFFTEETNLGDGDLRDEGLRTSLADFNLGNTFTWNVDNNSAGAAFIQVKGGTKEIKADEVSGTGEAAEQSAIQKDILIGSAGNPPPKDAMLAELVYEINDSGSEVLVEGECKNGTDITFFNRSWGVINFLDEIKGDQNPGMKFRPSVAIWARIKESGAGKTVDMVPAIPEYDNLLMQPLNASLNGFGRATGGAAGAPLLRFFAKTSDDASGIRLTKDYFKNNAGQTRDAKWKQKAYIANDPRINWAPEQWWATAQATAPDQLWFNEVKNFREADTTRDSDIFMSVSDQGYLQSMYEWMMIPQVREINGSGNLEWGAFENGNGYNGVVRTDKDNVLHANVMWRTYRSDAFGYNDTWGSIDGLAFDDADNGLRVNPYTDNMNVMLGAFANMPRDWWAASTNHLANGKNYMAPGSATFKDDYLFDWSCTYKDVYNMAYYWHMAFRREDLAINERGRHLYLADAWKDVFEDAVDWRLGDVRYSEKMPEAAAASKYDTSALQVGTTEGILKDLTFAERKFLYGYLKGCFANTAQLFLLFVRAETTGGGAVGAGARAVALVWRDPRPPTDAASGNFKKSDGSSEQPEYGKDNGSRYLRVPVGRPEEAWRLNERFYPPHRTRILFYHQFD